MVNKLGLPPGTWADLLQITPSLLNVLPERSPVARDSLLLEPDARLFATNLPRAGDFLVFRLTKLTKATRLR